MDMFIIRRYLEFDDGTEPQFIGPFETAGEAEEWIQHVGQKQDDGYFAYEVLDLRSKDDDFSNDGDLAYATVMAFCK